MKKWFGRFLVLFAVLCFVGFADNAAAQDLDDVTIGGKVVDSNNAPIVGATVVARLAATGVERTVVSDEEGRYRIVELAPGTYSVKARAQGFGAKEQIDLVTIAGQNVQLDFSLAPAGVQAEQTVTIGGDDAPVVDTTRTIVGGTVTEQQIEELPNASRNPLDLIFTLGGVTEEPLSLRDLAGDKGDRGEGAPSGSVEEAGIFSLSGGAAYSNNITIDGMDNNDDRAATFRFQPARDSISEVQVITNQFSAEYGRASGGRVNFRTRAGGKDFRGRVSYYFRDEALNANTWRNNSRPRQPGVINRIPALQEHIPYFSLSGPLLPFGYFKNKTFFFTGYEYQDLFENTRIDTYVPVQQNSRYPLPQPTDPAAQINVGTAAAPVFVAPFLEDVPTPLRNHSFTARVDHNFTSTHNITFNFQLGMRDDFRQFSGGSRLANALIGTSRDTRAFNFTDNYVFSANVVNQFKMQYSTLTPRAVADDVLTAPVILITLPTLLDRGTTLISGSTTGSSDRDEKRWQFQDSVTVISGSHSLKFGADVQRVDSMFIDRGDATGTFNFASPGTFLTTTVSRYRHNFGTTSEQQNTYTGFFFQDEWRLRSNFTLSMGLRYERESIIDDTNNFGPRFAIAWDPFKKGNTVVRVGAGIFFNRALLRTIDDYSLTTSTLVFDTNAIPSGGPRDAVLAQLNAVFPTPLTQTQAQAICTANNLACGNTAFGRILDPSLKIPESYQINVGFEREIGKDFVFEANYTWNKTARLWREFNSNAISLNTLNARTGGNFNNFAEYLLSQSFANVAVGGIRPFYNTNGARDVIRFTLGPGPAVGDPTRCTGTIAPTNVDQGGCQIINGVPTTLINLNSLSAINTSAPITVALAVLNQFRPDPTRTQLEQLASIGNARYNGLILELRRRFRPLGFGFGASLRFVYTLSSSMDDGIVNTSSAQFSGDFTSEWARSLQDRRHRFAFSGTIESPYWMGKLKFSPILRLGSSAPFNLSGGGVDRNLDDVNTDRPNFSNNPSIITWREPGEPFPQNIFDALSRPTIGTRGGNLGRNAGHGPGLFLFDLSISREFKFSERMRLRPNIEINNVFNSVVFSYGTAFINQTDPQNTFLIPTRTYRPREIRLGMRFDF